MKDSTQRPIYQYFDFLTSKFEQVQHEQYHVNFHKHNAIEILSSDGLSGYAQTATQKILFKDSYIIVIPAGVGHATHITGNTKSKLLLVLINSEKLKNIFSCFSKTLNSFDKKLNWLLYGKQILAVPREIAEEELVDLNIIANFKKNDTTNLSNSYFIFTALSVIHRILKHIEIIYKGCELPSVRPSSKIAKIIEYLDNYYLNEINLHKLAQIANISEYCLCRTFKNETGQNIMKYINFLRITHALGLINKGAQNVTSVCFASGFNDLNYFIQTFKKFIGYTPKKYALSKKNDYAFSQTSKREHVDIDYCTE